MKTSTQNAVSATSTTVDTSKLCKVTNNSGGDIVVALPVDSAETELTTPVYSFNKDFEVLTTSSGGTVIKNGGSDTVTLNRTYINSKTNKPTYSLGYDLLISSADWYSPVANIGVVQDFDPDEFDPQTVTAANLTAMQQTVAFYQTIAAYPDSQLAKDYVAAMDQTSNDAGSKADGSSGSGSNVQNAIAGGVANFFKNTKSYQQVTLTDIVALENYYNVFPFAWAQFKDTVSYFLYSSDGTTTSFQGQLSIKKTGNVDITKANGGYTCQFVPAVAPTDTTKTDVDTTKARTLTYVNGLFLDDTNSDTPQISLKGSFQLKRTFTKDPADTTIMPIISGTINGAISVGFDAAQATKSDNTTDDWLDSLFHPKTAAAIFASVMTILGALMMLHFLGTTLYGIGKWVREKAAAKEPVDKADLDAKKTSIQDDYKAKIDKMYEKVMGDKTAKVPDTSPDAVNQGSTAKDSLSDQVSAAQTEDNLVKMKNNLKDVEPYAVEDGALQQRVLDAATDVRTNYNTISEADLADLKSTLADMRIEMKGMSDTITQLNTDIQNMVAESEKATMQQNKENMEDVKTAVDNESKTAEDEAGDGTSTDPKGDEVKLPEFGGE